MRFTRLACLFAIGLTVQARAAYAPIPEATLGNDWTFETLVSASHDSNIFAASSGEIGSEIFTVTPKVSYAGSLTDQAFLSGYYRLNLDHFTHRPGNKDLISHDFNGRLAYAFSKTTSVDLADTYSIEKNPASALPGVATPISSEQSYKRNEFNATGTFSLGPKVGLSLKGRSVEFMYDSARLGADLDRTENIYGLTLDYAYQPEIKVVGEYRHQIIRYDQSGGTKNKTSDFLLGGADYSVEKKITASGRLGGENRRRDGEDDSTVPYFEGTLKYDYAEKSYLTVGYVYTLEEASNVTSYTDSAVNRFFANVQHHIKGPYTASASLDYEPSQLKGRIGLPDIDERTFRLGLGAQYSPTVNWTFAVSYDYDNVNSDDAGRGYNRRRFGATARLTY